MNEQPLKHNLKENIEYYYYKKILEIVSQYLGQESHQFLSRQVSLYFKKDPKYLNKTDIPRLAIRIRSGLLVLTHDSSLVDEVFRRIIAISDEA